MTDNATPFFVKIRPLDEYTQRIDHEQVGTDSDGAPVFDNVPKYNRTLRAKHTRVFNEDQNRPEYETTFEIVKSAPRLERLYRCEKENGQRIKLTKRLIVALTSSRHFKRAKRADRRYRYA